MERKIGETFEYEGYKLKVTDEDLGCHRCFFYTRGCIALKMRGSCTADSRTDRKQVIFVEVKDEQPQEQAEQPRKLNLCEILKYCPKGTELWSDDYGKVEFLCIDTSLKHPIKIIRTDGNFSSYTKEGWCNINFPASCLLWPSKDCRDWSKFTAPRLKKEKFDPKTLKAFDKVLTKYDGGCWSANLFSHIEERDNEYCAPFSVCNGSLVKFCIPYNEETKHLVGTTDEAPEFYRYWED